VVIRIDNGNMKKEGTTVSGGVSSIAREGK